jgi:hypothetical protein
MEMKLDNIEYKNVLTTIQKYLNDIWADENGEIQGIPDAEDVLDDILLDLGIDKP